LNNVLVEKNGCVKIIDFGYSKKINNCLTASVCGTFHAMAPEILDNK
jgi:serine/threonine protein kinase